MNSKGVLNANCMNARPFASRHLFAVAVAALVVLGGWQPPQSAAQDGAAAARPVVQPAIPTKNMLSAFRDGGPMMYPIAACSFALMVFVFERFIALRRGRVIPRPFVRRFLEQLSEGQIDREKALKLCQENKSPIALVFAAAVKKWGRASVEVEQAILDSGERVANQLRRYLRLMSGISQVTPLLGLLGTVMGMIISFNGISSAAGADAQREMLSGGIAQALIATAAGMLVAIPALTAYLYFVGRVDQLVTEIDALGQQVVELIAADSDGRVVRKKAA
jgi:biopolymer transport protein ExbB